MNARAPVLLCLDSGTTTVKAAAFDRDGRMIAASERANHALRREGARVEQDMACSRDDAFEVLRECADDARSPVDAILVTAQGDGLWALDARGEPVGHAFTWLDGRTRTLVAELEAAGTLERIRAVTGSRPTAATQSLHLRWLADHEPGRLHRIAHVLRLKEWLFHALTDELLGEPSSVLPTWGSWRTGLTSDAVEQALGLERGLALLPELRAVGECRAGLSAAAAARLGLPAGTPVLQGPGDVQATLIGLGLGTRTGVRRASIFGTSAIHASLQLDAEAVRDTPAGAIVLKFAIGPGYFCVHPCFNGVTVMQHLQGLVDGWPEDVAPAYSPLIVHPFLEPGGERAPYTRPDASGAVLGLDSQTTPAQIAWAAREALAFVARISHEMMGVGSGALSLGGGLAGDPRFAQWLATVMQAPVMRSTSSHASLRGLAAIGARCVLGASDRELFGRWIGEADETVQPEPGPVADYARSKFEHFRRTIDALAPQWRARFELAALAARARSG